MKAGALAGSLSRLHTTCCLAVMIVLGVAACSRPVRASEPSRYDKGTAVQTYFERAVTSESARDFGSARADLTRCIELDPNFAPAYSERAFTFAIDKDFTHAMADCERSLSLKKDVAYFWYNCARVNWMKAEAGGSSDDWQRAVQNLDEAIRLKPEFGAAYSLRGGAYAAQHDFEHAVSDCQKSIELAPRDSMAHLRCGITYNLKRNYDRAITEFSTALQYDPNLIAAYRGRGSAYRSIGDFERSKADFSEALKRNPAAAAH